ncbi:hypothetical protein H8S45_14295 [Agathobaculum sp. NSJ-28]|uniref:Uncharacterized protein n=1 Tax=Agathobaculum faecis TaxID=2763013 RepID=A0A923LZ27_9FIRM|nr:hypothetical protein [Agathobaculum faecis]MBC5726622.1 hypothetical protein [Agathobaculum faecis]
MDLIQHMRRLFAERNPDEMDIRLRVTYQDGTVLTGKYTALVGPLDNEPEIAEIDFYRDDNGALTGAYEDELADVEIME